MVLPGGQFLVKGVERRCGDPALLPDLLRER
jgi:hypothetical protein